MCGIAGILTLSPQTRIEPQPLRTMADQLRHRGPDDDGVYVDPQGRCGLAFRRLSIIDLASGHQPMSTPDGHVWLVFNGEIYNFRELREDLRARGYAFRTQSDSEVILHAYQAFGDGFVSRLAGMFALALWDEPRGRLLLVRDRFGKKPLTYAVVGDRLYFASEAKAILALPEVPREVDPQALHEYLLFQYVPAPRSVWRRFQKLPPAHLLTVRAGDAAPAAPRRWWEPPRPAKFKDSYADAKRELERLLLRAVERRLIADVPLGAFLSGGIDSSIVVAMMRRLGVSPLRTFSIGFADSRYDERPFAALVARRFETEHHEFVVAPHAMEALPTLAWHYDEPFADSSAIPTWYVARQTRGVVTVALTGDAGDECFLGYDRYRAARAAATLDWLPAGARRALARLGRTLPRGRAKSATHRAFRFLDALPERGSRRYLAWVNVWPAAALSEGYRREFSSRIEFDGPLAWFDGVYEALPGRPEDRANRADFLSYLPFDLLTKVDVASMAVGLECRSPFLDHELVEFAVSLPADWRIGKRILRDVAAGVLPRCVLSRPKMGFGIPVGEWFRGELRDELRERLLDPAAFCACVLERSVLERTIDEHVSGLANHEHRLWALFMLEAWARTWRPDPL
ncbi:MAG: asparagine synthase (glutamine-hydrolyzing) [Phycisphaerae bacterium]|jgi:asparagine synthase (glutamine-hydrolysing)